MIITAPLIYLNSGMTSHSQQLGAGQQQQRRRKPSVSDEDWSHPVSSLLMAMFSNKRCHCFSQGGSKTQLVIRYIYHHNLWLRVTLSPCSSHTLAAQRRGGCQLENVERRDVRNQYHTDLPLQVHNGDTVIRLHILKDWPKDSPRAESPCCRIVSGLVHTYTGIFINRVLKICIQMI